MPTSNIFRRSRLTKASLSVACFFLLNGCTSMQVHMGMKVYLEKTPVSTIQASLPQGPTIAPGDKSPLVVTFTEPGGKALTTEGKGDGQVMWKELNVTATVVSIDQKGNVSLPSDPRLSDGKTGHLTVTVPSHPDLRADLDVSIAYNKNYVANFSGRNGSDGTSGMDGIDGTSGSSGSMDPNNPSAGGNGGNGTDGSNGSDGDPGGNAAPVEIRIALRPGATPLLQASVSAGGKENFYLINPTGGSLAVKADGGRGGSGGRGGRGGHGGSGGIGTPNGSSGSNGSDGRNGSDGFPGRGGLITVTYDPQAGPYLGVIHLSSAHGPAPVFKQESVAALW